MGDGQTLPKESRRTQLAMTEKEYQILKAFAEGINDAREQMPKKLDNYENNLELKWYYEQGYDVEKTQKRIIKLNKSPL